MVNIPKDYTSKPITSIHTSIKVPVQGELVKTNEVSRDDSLQKLMDNSIAVKGKIDEVDNFCYNNLFTSKWKGDGNA